MNRYKTKILKTKAKYSIIIGDKILNLLNKRIKNVCPQTKKIVLVIDKKILKNLRVR